MRHDSFRRQFAFSLQSNPVVRQLHYLAGGKRNPDIPVIKSCLKKTKSDANDRDLAASALDTVGRIRTDSTTSKTSTRHKKRCVAGGKSHLPGRLATSPHFSHERIKSFFSPSKSRINSGKARNSPRKHGGSAPSTPPVSSGVAIPVPDSDDELLDSVPSNGLNHKTTCYGEAFKTFKRHENATANTYKVTSCQEPADRLASSCSGTVSPHGASQVLPTAPMEPSPNRRHNPTLSLRLTHLILYHGLRLPILRDRRQLPQSVRGGKKDSGSDPEQEHVESTELPNKVNLEDHEWEQALGQSSQI